MFKVLQFIFAALVLCFVAVGEIKACKCVQRSLEQYVKRSSPVFSGTVSKKEDLNTVVPEGSVKLTFSVDKVWKGKADAEYVVYTKVNSSGDCGLGRFFKVGYKYIVFAYRLNEGLATNRCTPTNDYSEELADKLDAMTTSNLYQFFRPTSLCV